MLNRAPRLRFRRPLSSTLDQEHRGQLHNISQSGCMVRVRHWVKINEEQHQLLLETADEPIQIKGEVVRARMVGNDHGVIYELGIRFDAKHPAYDRLVAWLGDMGQDQEKIAT